MKSKDSTSFPFDLITVWIRPHDMPHEFCMFCRQEPVTYRLYHYIDMFSMVPGGGLIDINAAWKRAIQQQMAGIYTAELYQPVCDECMQRHASIALGSKKTVRLLLTLADIAKKQTGIELSHVLCCTVASADDEGDNWAMNAPNTTIEDVVKHIHTRTEKF
jgi:hypothetical protein